MGEKDEIEGYVDKFDDFRGVSEKDAAVTREHIQFTRIFSNIWGGIIRATTLIDLKVPDNHKLSIVVCKKILYEGTPKKLKFPPTGLPLPLSRCQIFVEASSEPDNVTCLIQHLDKSLRNNSQVWWGGFFLDIFDGHMVVNRDLSMLFYRMSKSTKRRPSLLMTTSHYLKDYFWESKN